MTKIEFDIIKMFVIKEDADVISSIKTANIFTIICLVGFPKFYELAVNILSSLLCCVGILN